MWMNESNVNILYKSLKKAAHSPQDTSSTASKLMERLRGLPDFDSSNETTNHFELFDSKTDSFLGTEIRWESEQIKEPYWRNINGDMDISQVVKTLLR